MSGPVIDLTNLPAEMRDAKRFLLWKFKPNKDPAKKPRKVPFYANGKPRNGVADTPTDQAQFATLDVAVLALQSGRYTGLGFALGPDGTGNCWQGVDFDDMPKRSHLRELAPHLPGYIETSPSGDGIHAIGYGKPFDSMGSNSSGIEAYSSGRFFTVTGMGACDQQLTDLADFVVKKLRPIHDPKLNIGDAEPDAAEGTVKPSGDESGGAVEILAPQTVLDLRSALLFLRSDDRDLWIRMGFALKPYGDIGRGLFMDFSATSDKFDPADASQTWESFKPNRTGYAAVFAAAQRAGWLNPSRGIQKTKHTTVKQRGVFGFKSIGEIQSTRKTIPALIEGMFEQGSLIFLVAETGSYKTFMILDWAASIATGTSWCGCDVAEGPVFVILGEGFYGIPPRSKAWETYHGVDLSTAPIFVSETAAQLLDPGSVAAVCDSVEQLAGQHGTPSLIAIDTLHRNFGNGNEDSAADVAKFLAGVDSLRHKFGCAVLVVHHSGHSSKERGRGSSSLRAAADTEFMMVKSGDDAVTLTCTKRKEDAPPPDRHFRTQEVVLPWFDADGELLTSLVLVPTDSFNAPAVEPRGVVEKSVMDALDGLSIIAAVFDDALVEHAARSLPLPEKGKRDRRKEHARRALSRLVDAGSLICENGEVNLPHASRTPHEAHGVAGIPR